MGGTNTTGQAAAGAVRSWPLAYKQDESNIRGFEGPELREERVTEVDLDFMSTVPAGWEKKKCRGQEEGRKPALKPGEL